MSSLSVSGISVDTFAPSPAPTETPTQAPTPEPTTPRPTPKPTPKPTPAPTPARADAAASAQRGRRRAGAHRRRAARRHRPAARRRRRVRASSGASPSARRRRATRAGTLTAQPYAIEIPDVAVAVAHGDTRTGLMAGTTENAIDDAWERGAGQILGGCWMTGAAGVDLGLNWAGTTAETGVRGAVRRFCHERHGRAPRPPPAGGLLPAADNPPGIERAARARAAAVTGRSRRRALRCALGACR